MAMVVVFVVVVVVVMRNKGERGRELVWAKGRSVHWLVGA